MLANEVTVWCVRWGDKYSPDYVYNLRNMVRRHLKRPHRFVCITDEPLETIETLPPQCKYPGWWQKVSLFKPGVATGPSLYIDLDSVVVGSLDKLVDDYAGCELAIPINWSQSGHGGLQSSCMVWRGNSAHKIWNSFDFDRDSPDLWGDQEWIYEVFRGQITPIPHPLVCSYKYHCRAQKRPPDGAVVVTFHGKPDPHECRESWIVQEWQ